MSRKREKPTTLFALFTAFWLANPDATHDTAIMHAKANGYRRHDIKRLRKLSHQAKSLLNQAADGNGGPSQLTIARRNKTRAANGVAKRKRHPRESDVMTVLRTWWQKNMKNGTHDEAMQHCADRSIAAVINQSYSARSLVRKETRTDDGSEVTARAVTPTATTPEEASTTLEATSHGSIADQLREAKGILDEASSCDPLEAALQMRRAMKVLEVGVERVTAALAAA